MAPTNYFTTKMLLLGGCINPEQQISSTENAIKDHLIKSGWMQQIFTAQMA